MAVGMPCVTAVLSFVGVFLLISELALSGEYHHNRRREIAGFPSLSAQLLHDE